MSIAMRIYFGMGAMVLLVFAIGGFSGWQTNALARTFMDYRATSHDSHLAENLVEELYESRIASGKYRLTKDKAYLADLEENVRAIQALRPGLDEISQSYPELARTSEVPNMMQTYLAKAKQASTLQDQRNVLAQQTAQTGLKARQQLSEVMTSALADSDTEASAAAGFATTHLLLARLYLERFLVDNEADDAARSKQEVEAARGGLEALLQVLENPRMDAIGPEALTLVLDVVTAATDRQTTLGDASVAQSRRANMVMVGFVVFGVATGGALAVYIARTITTRLNRTTRKMTELADGNLDINIDTQRDKTEFGRMMQALAVFRDNAKQAQALDLEVKEKEAADRAREQEDAAREKAQQARQQQAEQEKRAQEQARLATFEAFQKDMEHVLGEAASGQFANRISTDIPDDALAGLAAVINQLLEQTETNINDIVQSIGELSQGNLGVRIKGERRGAFLRMKDDFNSALVTLSKTIADIMESGVNVSENSAHLEKSSKAMATRAEENAASVEETSAAIEEITASIKQVVENARSANEATRRVGDSADKTRKVSDQTEASINGMTEASQQINRVVKVIEDIAFQINLLALNAGVEAARAGEAGRGFSVVASEVRALAQRSQEAVQEISQVIDQNNQSVEAGVQQVALSRKALEEIVAEVEVASGQIAEIAMAVEQQSAGIEEVNTAVQSIDKTAQTNAAALEEMTAASVSMSRESSTLAQTLEQFHGVPLSARTKTAPVQGRFHWSEVAQLKSLGHWRH